MRRQHLLEIHPSMPNLRKSPHLLVTIMEIIVNNNPTFKNKNNSKRSDTRNKPQNSRRLIVVCWRHYRTRNSSLNSPHLLPDQRRISALGPRAPGRLPWMLPIPLAVFCAVPWRGIQLGCDFTLGSWVERPNANSHAQILRHMRI